MMPSHKSSLDLAVLLVLRVALLVVDRGALLELALPDHRHRELAALLALDLTRLSRGKYFYLVENIWTAWGGGACLSSNTGAVTFHLRPPVKTKQKITQFVESLFLCDILYYSLRVGQ